MVSYVRSATTLHLKYNIFNLLHLIRQSISILFKRIYSALKQKLLNLLKNILQKIQLLYNLNIAVWQMNSIHIISEFNTDTPKQKFMLTTAKNQNENTTSSSGCRFCQENISKMTDLRKKQILLQLQIEKLKQQLTASVRENEELINSRIITYSQYQQKMELCNTQIWNREDLQAELFESKVIIQLLLSSKKIEHPQIKSYDYESLKGKYSDLLIENLRMQEKVMARDRIIEERVFLPLYHYDQRVISLRKAMIHWYRKAEGDCLKMKMKCNAMKKQMSQEIEDIRQEMIKEFNNNNSMIEKFVKPTVEKKKNRTQGQKNKVVKNNGNRKEDNNNPSRSIRKIR